MAYLFWAYLVVWLALAAYLLWLRGRLRRVAREVERLEAEMRGEEVGDTGGQR